MEREEGSLKGMLMAKRLCHGRTSEICGYLTMQKRVITLYEDKADCARIYKWL